MMTTEPLTNIELAEHVRTALGGVGPQQVKRVMKGVRGLCDRAEAAEKRVQELTAAIDDWRERAEEAEGKLAKTADDLAAALWRVAKLETDYVSENRLRGEAAASAANLEAQLAAQQTAACPHCGKPLAGQKLAPF